MGFLEEIEGEDFVPGNKPAAAQKPGGFLEEIEARSAPMTADESAVTKDTPWSEVLTRGAKNIPSDFIQTGQDVLTGIGSLAKAAAHPIESYEKAKNLDWGAIGNQLQHDYLTEEGWKQGLAERPVSRLMDVGMVTAGPAGLASKAAMAGNMPRLAKGISIAQKVTDPAAWAVEGTKAGLYGANRLGNELVGHTMTHTGGESLNLLYDAGRESKEMARAARAGINQKDPIAAVRDFETAMKAGVDEVHNSYRADKNALRTDQQRLSFTPVDNAIRQAEVDFIGHTAVNPNPDVVNVINEAKALVAKQKRASARYALTYGSRRAINPYQNPIGMDELKKALGRITDNATGEARAAAARIQEAVANEIKSNSPIYHGMMEDYAKMSDALNSYKRELSLGGNNADTALRKLLSSLRNNVTANYGRRKQLVHRLSDKHDVARRGLYNLAGQTNSAWGPRGLIGQFKLGAAPFAGTATAMGYINPWLWAALPMQSPQLVGRANIRMGQIARGLNKVPWRPAVYAGNMASHSPFYQEFDEEE